MTSKIDTSTKDGSGTDGFQEGFLASGLLYTSVCCEDGLHFNELDFAPKVPEESMQHDSFTDEGINIFDIDLSDPIPLQTTTIEKRRSSNNQAVKRYRKRQRQEIERMKIEIEALKIHTRILEESLVKSLLKIRELEQLNNAANSLDIAVYCKNSEGI